MTAETFDAHPWDKYGTPPPIAPSYEDTADELPIEAALAFAEKWRTIEELREDAERAEDRARDLERDADELEKQLATVPGLADAIGDDPYRFDNADDLREWMAEKGR